MFKPFSSICAIACQLVLITVMGTASVSSAGAATSSDRFYGYGYRFSPSGHPFFGFYDLSAATLTEIATNPTAPTFNANLSAVDTQSQTAYFISIDTSNVTHLDAVNLTTGGLSDVGPTLSNIVSLSFDAASGSLIAVVQTSPGFSIAAINPSNGQVTILRSFKDQTLDPTFGNAVPVAFNTATRVLYYMSQGVTTSDPNVPSTDDTQCGQQVPAGHDPIKQTTVIGRVNDTCYGLMAFNTGTNGLQRTIIHAVNPQNAPHPITSQILAPFVIDGNYAVGYLSGGTGRISVTTGEETFLSAAASPGSLHLPVGFNSSAHLMYLEGGDGNNFYAVSTSTGAVGSIGAAPDTGLSPLAFVPAGTDFVTDNSKNDGCNCADGTTQNYAAGRGQASPPVNGNGAESAQQTNPATGNYFHTTVDYVGKGPFPLVFARSYNSDGIAANVFGARWSATYFQRLVPLAAGVLGAIRPDGKTYRFSGPDAAGNWTTDADVSAKLVTLRDAGGNFVSFQYKTADDIKETYDVGGNLTKITNRAGLSQTIALNGDHDPTQVTDSFGRTLTFTYVRPHFVKSITDPAGNVYSYEYTPEGYLFHARAPGTAQPRTYSYEGDDPTNGRLALMNGITDEKNSRFITITHDSDNRTTATVEALGSNAVTTDYSNINSGVSVSTNALGRVTTYNFAAYFGTARASSIVEACPSCTAPTVPSTITSTFAANGGTDSVTDGNGNKTTYQYDLARNLELSRTEASGTANARTVATQWGNTFRVPVRITEPLRRTDLSYNGQGVVIKRTVTDLGTNATRIWTYTPDANGQITVIDGPRTDIADTTKMHYDAKGNLDLVTDALNHQWQMPSASYDAHGNPKQIIDPNGLVTLITYDARERVTARKVGALNPTTYIYDDIGELTKITNPDLSTATFTYDATHRLTKITDDLGNYRVYTLDALGNRTKEETFTIGGVKTFSRAAVFDGLNRQVKEINGLNNTTSYAYDADGNRTSAKQPNNDTETWAPDALNRLRSYTDAAGGQTVHSYDTSDNETFVRDPLTHLAAYTYDGLGNQKTASLPDSGQTTRTFDAAGNVLTATDAAGRTVTATYDALNRVTKLTYANLATPTTFTYDTGANGLGHLTGMSDPSGSTGWTYDQYGRVTAKTVTAATTAGNAVMTTQYAYDPATGHLTGITYPSGMVARYSWSTSRITGVSLNSAPFLSAITWQPFGPVKGWNWSDATAYARTYDLAGRPVSYALGGTRSRTVGYDTSSRISTYTDTDATRNQTFQYDSASRLKNFVEGASVRGEAYTYDLNGNRKTLLATPANTTSTYTGSGASNRLPSTSLPGRTYTYDATGNVTADGTGATFTYDGRNRLVATSAGSSSYLIDGQGRRVAKTSSGFAASFSYDEEGRMLGKYGVTGGVISRSYETVYLGDTPIAVATGANASPTLYRVYPDHLDAPRAIARNTTGAIVWRWDSNPFGSDLPNEDVDGDGQKLSFSLRFPGQYYDAETGLMQNGMRDYNPGIGRYMQSDPIGLEGGINTFGYVGQNPLMYVDPKGTDIWIEGPSAGEPAGHQSINIGNPFGNYDSYSFAFSLGTLGAVYLDVSFGGPIEAYLPTTPDQDAIATKEILDSWAADSGDFYGLHTCRTYSQDKFNRFKKEFQDSKFGDNPILPPHRTPAPWDRGQSFPATTREPTSTTTSSTGSGPSR